MSLGIGINLSPRLPRALLGAGGGVSYPLDLVPNAAAAYSVARKLRAGYTGSALRLRRDSDNAESDFGFTGVGVLDTGAITAWLAGAGGFVRTLYDQSGNNRNIEQSTTSRQPQFSATSGANFTPAAVFDNTNDWMSFSVTVTQETLVWLVRRATNGETAGHILAFSTSYRLFLSSVAGRSEYTYNASDLNRTGLDQTVPRIYQGWFDGTTRFFQVDDSAVSSGVGTAAEHTFDRIGTRSADSELLNGVLSEGYIYASALSDAQRDIIKADMRRFYGL